MFNELISRHWLTFHSFVVLLGLVIYSIDSHTRRKRRHPSAAIAWIVSLALLPYIALPLYFFFGSRKLGGIDRTEFSTKQATFDLRFARNDAETLAIALGLDEEVSFENLSIHQDGSQALKSLIASINGAQRTLDICSFLVGRDVLGQQISELLIVKAKQGVRVRLLVDGVGYYMGGFPNFSALKTAGVKIVFFASLMLFSIRGRTNLRNHRKLLIADGDHLCTGGRNLAAEYFEGDPESSGNRHPWIDLSFDLTGPLAQQAQQRFDSDWLVASEHSYQEAAHSKRSSATHTGGGARLVPSGPDQVEDTIYTMIVSGCFTARSRILAVTPYFVPDQTLLMAMTLAARRGVNVELVIPYRSNHRLADIARHSSLRDLATAGAKIWLFPGMIHAKAIIFDSNLALVGSANLDERSLFLNYELMVAFYEASAVQGFTCWLDKQRSQAEAYIVKRPNLGRELAEGIVRWVAFQL